MIDVIDVIDVIGSYQEVFEKIASQNLHLRFNSLIYVTIPFHSLIRIVPRDCSYDEERIPLHPLNIYDDLPALMSELEQKRHNKKNKQQSE